MLVEDYREWACQAESSYDPLFGTFLWPPTNTSSDGICPYGSKNDEHIISYAYRSCFNGVWSDEIDARKCRFKPGHSNLKNLLDITEKVCYLIRRIFL